MNLNAITQEMLTIASQEIDLDDAIAPLLTAAGIDNGTVSGMVFCGPNGDDWPTATPQRRLELLDEWMRAERAHA